MGNRLKLYQPSALGSDITYEYQDHNILQNVNGVNYTYDNKGNLTNRENRTYTYDIENRLTKIEENGTVIAEYWYDHAGNRVRSVENGETTYSKQDGYKRLPDETGTIPSREH